MSNRMRSYLSSIVVSLHMTIDCAGPSNMICLMQCTCILRRMPLPPHHICISGPWALMSTIIIMASMQTYIIYVGSDASTSFPIPQTGRVLDIARRPPPSRQLMLTMRTMSRLFVSCNTSEYLMLALCSLLDLTNGQHRAQAVVLEVHKGGQLVIELLAMCHPL